MMNSASDWLAYYQKNSKALLTIPWEVGPDLTPEEVRDIRQSLREFQAGERSEGLHLMTYAQRYAEKTGNFPYIDSIKLFILEEQRHARDLGRFLTLNGVELVQTTFTDSVFRKMRNLIPSLELSVAVLITAEIIAKVYYLALKEATKSAILIRLCEQILYDELSHVEFQSDQLYTLRKGRGFLKRLVTMGLQRFLFFGTVIVVWFFHRRVMIRSGRGFGAWWKHCWLEFNGAFPREKIA